MDFDGMEAAYYSCMCIACRADLSRLHHPAGRRAFVFAVGAFAAVPASRAQVEVGKSSVVRNLVPADTIERAGVQQYGQLLAAARAKGALAPDGSPPLQRLRAIATRLVPFCAQWNPRAAQWQWQVNLIGSPQVNAFCMPGGKIAFFTGLVERLHLSDDEIAMVMGHEMAHALREHARARLAKSAGTSAALSITAQALGLGRTGDLAARVGTELLTLKFSRSDETDADLVGLELAARAGFEPAAAVTLWKKMAAASRKAGGLGFLSTHPTGPDRIRLLERNLSKVEGLYRAARR